MSIDRRVLVRRHNPVVREANPRAALSVGNGGFAFTADFTGLQTFEREYRAEFPLSTQSNWGWNSHPLPPGVSIADYRFNPRDTYGRPVGYADKAAGQEALYYWLRQNPHRLHLGRIGLRWEGMGMEQAENIEQTLDLWTGHLASRFEIGGEPVLVETCCHPHRDLLAVRVRSGLMGSGRLGIEFQFPAPPPVTKRWEDVKAPAWDRDADHQTRLEQEGARRASWRRVLDDGGAHGVRLEWESEAALRPLGPHRFELAPAPGVSECAFVCLFAPELDGEPLPGVAETQAASAGHWADFWNSGAALELADSPDPRARELERRVVLSQYLMAVQCAGSLPPQETGLTCNSWFGKFHLEMHWWHGVHWALWGRLPLLERSLRWYETILPIARETADRQGYTGARWPKMVGPDGRDSPSDPGTLLIWQQPHPIFYAELCYRARPTRETLERFGTIVLETAEWMASYAVWHEGRFVLGPPLIPVSENLPADASRNPTFELAYWDWGLRTAQAWRERLGMEREPRWENVLQHLAPLPQQDSVYLIQEGLEDTYTRHNYEHPALLGALGILPPGKADQDTMRRTLEKVWETWNWDRKSWGWDFPMIAMTAARVGRPDLAVDALLLETTKNTYLLNGHNWQNERLPLYLPGNGGLLSAVAIMAGGWPEDTSGRSAPGFPDDGSWVVRHEGFPGCL